MGRAAPSLDDILKNNPRVWRGYREQDKTHNSIDSGFEALNRILPSHGWPPQSLIELNVRQWGQGELSVLLPLMRHLQQERQLVWIAPPHIPYAPALQQSGLSLQQLTVIGRPCHSSSSTELSPQNIWWAAEKVLRHPDCGAVLLWPASMDPRQVQRLQSIAGEQQAIAIILTTDTVIDTAVSLRLQIQRDSEHITISITKSRLGWCHKTIATLPARLASL
ncbi:MAG: translesion DNA synthesis-associated protein ImuA [Pseudomonadota bacterium]